ncbi:hypothetical protein JOF53_004076 [Crossiella equi]|uniref:DUF6779 domain-containing protein n=1 Tax=Crossiella equi TaxID=130796 RepID=A0ABS5AF42_9PSEU|nr:DUF6779 domain-containing protein [Crossiella equi]MBP2475204.1 hypothetical protein [Crossiella equi]
MNGRSDSTAEPRSTVRGNGIALLVAVLALAATAAVVLVVSDDARWLRLGVVAALWAALVGAFAAARYRKQAGDRAQRAEELHRVYELELECEVAARREYELEVESKTREKLEQESRSELEDLRKELRSLRENLEALLGGEVLVERVALRAESTRMRSLPDQRRLAISDRSDRVIASAEERIRKITANAVEQPVVRAQATRTDAVESTALIPPVKEPEVRADNARTAFVAKDAVRPAQPQRPPAAPQRQHVPPRKQTTPEPSRPDVQRSQPRREPERREPERREPEPAFAETTRLTRASGPQAPRPEFRRPPPEPQRKPEQQRKPEPQRPAAPKENIVAGLDGGAPARPAPARPEPAAAPTVHVSHPEPAVSRGQVIGGGQVQRPASATRSPEPKLDRYPEPKAPAAIDHTDLVARRYRPEPEPNEPAATPSWMYDAESGNQAWPEAESAGRRRKPESPAEEPAGRRRKPDYEPPAADQGRRRKPDPAPEPEPDAGGGRRRKPESTWDSGEWNPELSDESSRSRVDPDTGAHGGGGKSVSELLAAHGNSEPPRRRRRKDD